eukprot:6191235-Pleurochrysis_carterae.AAC.1
MPNQPSAVWTQPNVTYYELPSLTIPTMCVSLRSPPLPQALQPCCESCCRSLSEHVTDASARIASASLPLQPQSVAAAPLLRALTDAASALASSWCRRSTLTTYSTES